MISFQLEEVDAAFSDLKALEANGWVDDKAMTSDKENSRPKKRPVPKTKKVTTTTTSKPKPSSSLREMMAVRRKELNQQQQQENAKPVSVAALASPSPRLPLLTSTTASPLASPAASKAKDAEIVFDGGFFSVRSPLRTPNGNSSRNVQAGGGSGTKLNFD